MESRFCHFEMRCRAPIGKFPLPFASQDFSHRFEMTLGTFYPSLFPFGQLPVRFVSLLLPARPVGGRSATGLSFLAERNLNPQPLIETDDNRTVTLFCEQLNGNLPQKIGKQGLLYQNIEFVSLYTNVNQQLFHVKYRQHACR